MAFLFKFSIILFMFLFYRASNGAPIRVTDLRIAEPFSLVQYCSEYFPQSASRKLSCLVCKGFDISCFIKTSSTTTSSTTTLTPSTATQSTSTTRSSSTATTPTTTSTTSSTTSSTTPTTTTAAE